MPDAWTAMVATLGGSPVDSLVIRQLDGLPCTAQRYEPAHSSDDVGIRDLESAALWRALAGEVGPLSQGSPEGAS